MLLNRKGDLVKLHLSPLPSQSGKSQQPIIGKLSYLEGEGQRLPCILAPKPGGAGHREDAAAPADVCLPELQALDGRVGSRESLHHDDEPADGEGHGDVQGVGIPQRKFLHKNVTCWAAGRLSRSCCCSSCCGGCGGGGGSGGCCSCSCGGGGGGCCSGGSCGGRSGRCCGRCSGGFWCVYATTMYRGEVEGHLRHSDAFLEADHVLPTARHVDAVGETAVQLGELLLLPAHQGVGDVPHL